MIYSNTQPTVGLTSAWKCNFVVTSVGLQWYMTDKPTAASQAVTFPVALPYDAVIKRAWLSMGLSTPISGSAYQRMNGKAIPSSGEMDIEGITPTTTSFEAVFSFRANGIVYQNTQTHEGRLSIVDPTLHIEYDSASETPPDEDTVVSRPLDTGVQLPRMLDDTFREVARIDPDNLQLSLRLRPLSTAIMRNPPGEPEARVRGFFELFSPDGSVGIFRVTEVENRYGVASGQTVYLEHGFGTLADSLALGVQAMSAPVATVISTLLESQDEKHWVLGECEVPEDYEVIYEYSYGNLLEEVIGIIDLLPEEYAPEFDMLVHPFRLHIRKMPDEDACEGRMSRNLTQTKLSIDTSELCTVVYPFGAGEGTDRVTLTNLTGSQHLDSPNAETWGRVSRTFTSDEIFDALTLRDVAQRYLDRHDRPTVAVTTTAMDLYSATGEEFDCFRLGRVCRLALPEYGLTVRERVIGLDWMDVYNAPEAVEVSLANRLRDATDEIAALMREATNSKLLGGSVKSEDETSRAGGITPGSPFVQKFQITGYGNLLSVKTAYRCVTADGEEVNCSVTVDGNPVDAEAAKTRIVDVFRYLKADENGVPIVGEHTISLSPATLNTTVSEVENTITIKNIEKR